MSKFKISEDVATDPVMLLAANHKSIIHRNELRLQGFVKRVGEFWARTNFGNMKIEGFRLLRIQTLGPPCPLVKGRSRKPQTNTTLRNTVKHKTAYQKKKSGLRKGYRDMSESGYFVRLDRAWRDGVRLEFAPLVGVSHETFMLLHRGAITDSVQDFPDVVYRPPPMVMAVDLPEPGKPLANGCLHQKRQWIAGTFHYISLICMDCGGEIEKAFELPQRCKIPKEVV